MDDTNEKVYEKAVKLLSMRPHTTGELYRKLKTRGFKDSDIRPVLRKLEELRFLDDQRFAEIFVDNLKRYKDFGFYAIKKKLHERQIPSDLAEEALKQFFTVEDELEVARRAVTKLKRQGRTQWEQLMRSLESRGFRSEAIREVL